MATNWDLMCKFYCLVAMMYVYGGHNVYIFNCFHSMSPQKAHRPVYLPELTELFGLQEEVESSYGKLLRTMPRGLNVHWSSASSRGRQSLLPLALSVSDTASQQGRHKNQAVVFFSCVSLAVKKYSELHFKHIKSAL